MAAVKKANDQLREARQRTASSTHPHECLSRQELAKLINTWIWDHHNTIAVATANYVGQLERGTIRWPGKLCREALRAILGAPTDSVLGFRNARSRRTVLKRGSTLALAEPVAALLENREPTPIPARIGATDIEQTRRATQVFRSWSRTYGGGVVWDAVMGQLSYSAGLRGASCPESLRPELFSAVGDLADTAAYVALDACAPHEANRLYRFALGCAKQAHDWHLRAKVLSSMAAEAVLTGHPDEGLTLAEQALVRADDRLTATERAMLHGDRAFALARMRRVQEALRAIGTADEHFAHSTPEHDPFLAFYDDAGHARFIGQPLFDLAMIDHHPEQATTRLTAAAAGHAASNVRARTICLTKLASLTMVTGDPLQAVALGHQALDAADGIRSHRAADNLRELYRYAAKHRNLEEVAHLRHRIAMLLIHTDSPYSPPNAPVTFAVPAAKSPKP